MLGLLKSVTTEDTVFQIDFTFCYGETGEESESDPKITSELVKREPARGVLAVVTGRV